MTMLPTWTDTLAGDLLTLGVLLTAAVGVWRVGRRVVLFGDRLERSMKAVERELRPNGGESLRDRVDQLTHQHGSILNKLEQIETRIGGKP
jgi:hypothetical protein